MLTKQKACLSLLCTYIGWQAEGLIPYGDVTLSPASTILNYGRVFLKAQKHIKPQKVG